MDRKEFLSACAAGLCACGVGSLIPASALTAADKPAPAEDWRLRFVKERYGRLLELVSERMTSRDLDAMLHDLGSYCASRGDATVIQHRGNFEGFAKLIQQGVSGDQVTWDREKNVIIMASPERADCFCPLNSRAQGTPAVVCNCSLGWQQHTWETFLQRKVQVEIKESVLRGGKRCIFEIRIGEPV